MGKLDGIYEAGTEGIVPVKFLTGAAGTGKTYTVRQAIAADPHFGMLAATTGIAAVNLGAITLNSLLKYFDTRSLEEAFFNGWLQKTILKLAEDGYKWLVIDEISMLDGLQLDILYQCMKMVNEVRALTGDEPLGILLTGDFCFGLGTKIMMADGTIKTVEDITTNDLVMGPDSTPRQVLRTTRGADILYRIDQGNGDSYVVNSQHSLALTRGNNGKRMEPYPGGTFKRYPNTPDYITITAPDLASRSRKFRECFVGYKAGVIKFPEQDISVDPYFLGLWLGDGDKDTTRITTMDKEIAVYLEQYADSMNMRTVYHGWDRTEAVRIGLRGRERRKNKLLDSLRGLGVIGNKFIPPSYLFNSEEVRLQLLAGLLDTDGSWTGNRFSFCGTLRLSEGVKQLVDQLGFRGALYSQKASWIVTIGGDTWRIPTKIARKQSKLRNLGRSRMTSVLQITNVGVGEYAGFEVDGDNLFLLADGTVAHNCQLPPIKAKWAFEAECWPMFEAETERLTKCWRQTDARFLEAVNHIRSGRGMVGATLLHQMGVEFVKHADTSFTGTTIIAKNEAVDSFNWLCHSKIPGVPTLVTSTRWMTLGRHSPSEWNLIPTELRLKNNAYVMILSNDTPDFTYVNGDCGHIVDYSPESQTFKIRLIRNLEEVSIGKITRHVTQKEPPDELLTSHPGVSEDDLRELDREPGAPYWNPNLGRSGLWVVGALTYFPMKLAYASTVHKTQGLTLDKVQIDLNQNFMSAPGMCYVGISRCKTPAGLRIVGSPALLGSRVKTDPQVMRWL